MSYGGINADTLAQIVEEREEQIARADTLADALDHARRMAKNALLPDADRRAVLVDIVALAKRTTEALDAMLNAGLKTGLHYDLLDEEAMEWYEIAERRFHLLTAEGKRRFVAARKRADVRRQEPTRDTSAGTSGVPLTLHREDA